MINNKDFANRIQQIMDYYQLSSSSFANSIGVQRSSISHILSGRNKPSLDFVLKITKVYKEVELYWLLNGKGSFPPAKDETKQKEEKNRISTPVHRDFPSGKEKPIERIVIFYADGTFTEHTHK